MTHFDTRTFSSDEDAREQLVNAVERKVEAGYESVEEIIASITATFVADNERREEFEQFIRRITEQSFSSQIQMEGSWNGPTDCDKLDWLFRSMEASGIAARQNYLCCETCANAAIAQELKPAEIPTGSEKFYVGFVYFHQADTERAVRTGTLPITFGATTDDEHDMRRVGSIVMKAAQLAGLEAVWSGDTSERMKIRLDWRRRRATSYDFNPQTTPVAPRTPPPTTPQQSTPSTSSARPHSPGVSASSSSSHTAAAPAREAAAAPAPKYSSTSTELACPRQGCGGRILYAKSQRGKGYYACSNRAVNHCPAAYWYPPLTAGGPNGSNRCPKCSNLLLFQTSSVKAPQIVCSAPECDFVDQPSGRERYV